MMSHLIVSSLCYKNGKVTCIGTANNVDPYEYKPMEWYATIEQLFDDLVGGQIQPTKAANDYKWTVLLAQTLKRPKEHQIHFFKYMMNQGPKGNYLLRFSNGDHKGKYILQITGDKMRVSLMSMNHVNMSYYRCLWLRQNNFVLRDCAIVKV